MQATERSLSQPSLVGWARDARPLRLAWPPRRAVTAQPIERGGSRSTDPSTDRDPHLDDALFGGASLALVLAVLVAALLV